MPNAADMFENNKHSTRLLLYGEEKTKKTWWIAKAAEAGYKILLIDTDDGYQVIKQIKPEARNNIHILRVSDTIEDACAAVFTTLWMKGEKFNWLEGEKCIPNLVIGGKKPDEYLQLDPQALDKNWIVVLDSWTALATSLIKRWYDENSVDISDAEKHERGCYGYASMIGNWMMSQLKGMSTYTNVVVIGHKTVYEKYKTEIVNGKKVQVVDWSKAIIKSSSGPHGLTIGADFTDILYFSLTGTQFYIDTNKTTERPGGCRSVPPGRYKWDELTFETYAKYAGLAPPTNTDVTPIKVIKAQQQSASVAPVLSTQAGKIELKHK